MQAINSQSCQSAVTFLLPPCPFHPFCLLWLCSFPMGGLVVVLLRMHVTVCRPGAKSPMTEWKLPMPGIGHTRNSGRLKPGGFVSSTRLAPLAFLPNNAKWVEKASGKKKKPRTQQCTTLLQKIIPRSAKKKRKVSKTMQTIYIIPLKQLFKRRCVGMPQLFIFKLYLTTVMKWILRTGWLRHRGAEPTGLRHPPQPCLAESLSEVKLRTSHYILCVIFTTEVIAILAMALQLKQWAGGILCAEMPASALNIQIQLFISGGHKTWGYKVAIRHGDARWSLHFQNSLNLPNT